MVFRLCKRYFLLIVEPPDIRADKPPNRGVIIPGIEVVKPGIIQPLPGKELIRGGGGAGAGFAVPDCWKSTDWFIAPILALISYEWLVEEY